MDTNLFVEDKEIKKSVSNFATYPNEYAKYEGRLNLLNMSQAVVILNSRRLLDAVGFEIINAVYQLQFSTSRQITEYINIVKKIEVTQSQVSSKLKNFNSLSIIKRFSFVSDKREEGTNMKFYSLELNGKNLLISHGYPCNWKPTDTVSTLNVKNYLIRNQYVLKVYKECSNIDYLKLKKLTNGIGSTYSVNNNEHILIPVRRTENYENDLLRTYDSLEKNLDVINMNNEKYIIIGEDAKHIFNIFKFLFSRKLINSSTYFVTDLKLFDREIKKVFVRFGIKETNGKVDVIMKDELLEDF